MKEKTMNTEATAPVLTDSPVLLAIETRLWALLDRRPGPPISSLSPRFHGLPVQQRIVRVAHIAGAVAAVKTGRLSLEDVQAARFGLVDGELAETAAGRVVRRGAWLLLGMITHGLERQAQKDKARKAAESLPREESLPLHFPAGTRLIEVEDGQLIFHRDGQPLDVRPGDAVFVSPATGEYTKPGTDGRVDILGTVEGIFRVG